MQLGFQLPSGLRVGKFNYIDLDSYHNKLNYCDTHNFVFNKDEQEELLYNGKPCIYTDLRYGQNKFEFNYIFSNRYKPISLKACIRRTLGCRNIPVGTVIKFTCSWYYLNRKFKNEFLFKIKKENKFDPKYEVNHPSFSEWFTSDLRANELTKALRENGFLVRVFPNYSFLLGMLNTAISLTEGEQVDQSIPGECAIAYGFGKKIGFSSGNEPFQGYVDGCDNILWDSFGDFDKWSRCNQIPKRTNINEIINILVK